MFDGRLDTIKSPTVASASDDNDLDGVANEIPPAVTSLCFGSMLRVRMLVQSACQYLNATLQILMRW